MTLSGTSHFKSKQVKSTQKKPVAISQLGVAYVEEALRWMPSEEKQDVMIIETQIEA